MAKEQLDAFAARQLDIFDPLASEYDHFEWPECPADSDTDRAELAARHCMVWIPRVEFNRLRLAVWMLDRGDSPNACAPISIVEKGKDPIVWVKRDTLSKLRARLSNGKGE